MPVWNPFSIPFVLSVIFANMAYATVRFCGENTGPPGLRRKLNATPAFNPETIAFQHATSV